MLTSIGAKTSLFVGLVSLLIYVGSFFLAVLFERSTFVFIIGSAIGGVGAGILWTAQGSYYALNADLFAEKKHKSNAQTLMNFAAIFAAFYLSCEAAFKMIATGIYLAAKENNDNSWRIPVFGMYTAVAFVSVVAFYMLVLPLEEQKTDGFTSSQHGLMVDSLSCETETETETINSSMDVENPICNDQHQHNTNTVNRGIVIAPSTTAPLATSEDNSSPHSRERVVRDVLAVLKMMWSDRLVQCLIPYQVCFGLSSGFVNTYVTGVIVNDGLGEGYIGFLSGLATVAAVLLAGPFAMVSNSCKGGSWYVMVLGSVCFCFAGAAVLCMTNESIGRWEVIVPYFLVHGAARGVWENTNKAVVAEYFPDAGLRETAYAAIYFASGLAGAMGFLLSGFMSRDALAILNTVVPVIALITYHRSYALSIKESV